VSGATLRRGGACFLSVSADAVRHGLRTEFSPASLAEAARTEPPPLGARRDLRSVPIVTIDAPSSRDLDDALAVLPAPEDGGLRLLVSIADVAALVPERSALRGGPFHYDRVSQTLRGAGHSYMIGDAIEVRVVGANEELGRIELALEV
jgi:exoribonuclease R